MLEDREWVIQGVIVFVAVVYGSMKNPTGVGSGGWVGVDMAIGIKVTGGKQQKAVVEAFPFLAFE